MYLSIFKPVKSKKTPTKRLKFWKMNGNQGIHRLAKFLHVHKGHVLQYTHMEYHIQTTALLLRIRSCLSAPKARPPPNPPAPASLFTTKSDTSKAFQTTAIPVRTGLVFPPFPIVCLKPSLCTCKTHYLTCVEIYVYTVSQIRIQHHGASTYILHVHKGHVLQYTHTHMEYHIQATALWINH